LIQIKFRPTIMPRAIASATVIPLSPAGKMSAAWGLGVNQAAISDIL
jgi:hypothetical protein